MRLCGIALLMLAAGMAVVAGCKRPVAHARPRVVLYTSVDLPIVQPIIDAFTRQSGVEVELRTDAEASKTSGLAERLLAERDHPHADVWWNNEIFHTIRLADQGVLDQTPIPDDIPASYRDVDGRWAAAGLRMRVLALAGDSAATQYVRGLDDLTDKRLQGQIAMAMPAFGTTAGHVACLYQLWGDERADRFFQKLRDNQVQLLGGNSLVAQFAGQGRIQAGLSDNDDVNATIAEGGKAVLRVPDQGSDQAGTLALPCTVALVRGGPNPVAAKQLATYLLSAQVERQLEQLHFTVGSVRQPPRSIRWMKVDYAKAARDMPRAVGRALAILRDRP